MMDLIRSIIYVHSKDTILIIYSNGLVIVYLIMQTPKLISDIKSPTLFVYFKYSLNIIELMIDVLIYFGDPRPADIIPFASG